MTVGVSEETETWRFAAFWLLPLSSVRMSATTKKHRNFVSESIGSKSVTALPGIGPGLGSMLEKRGIDRADQALGHFLEMERDTEKFADWLRFNSSANAYQARCCVQGLQEYCDSYL